MSVCVYVRACACLLACMCLPVLRGGATVTDVTAFMSQGRERDGGARGMKEGGRKGGGELIWECISGIACACVGGRAGEG